MAADTSWWNSRVIFYTSISKMKESGTTKYISATAPALLYLLHPCRAPVIYPLYPAGIRAIALKRRCSNLHPSLRNRYIRVPLLFQTNLSNPAWLLTRHTRKSKRDAWSLFNLAVVAVLCEPVSQKKFLLSGNNAGNFDDFCPHFYDLMSGNSELSGFCSAYYFTAVK